MMKATMMTSTPSRQVNWSWRRRSYQFMCALWARLRVARCPLREAVRNSQLATRNSRPLLLDGRQHLQKVDRLPHVVHAHHRGAGAIRGGDRGERADGAIGSRVAAGQVSDERLARRADHHRRDAAQLVRAREQLEV